MKIKLFCFPYAGGSASVYYKWREYLNPDIELIPIELSGRGKRLGEPLYDSFAEMVGDVFRMVKDDLDETPYTIFGHSMGSWIAYELTYLLNDYGLQSPAHIFFSGRRPPYVRKDDEILHTLPNNELIEKLVAFGGISGDLVHNKKLLQLYMPIIRSDIRNVMLYQYQERAARVPSNITVFYGKEDDFQLQDVIRWQDATSCDFDFYGFEGGHFFIFDKAEKMVDIINTKLRNIYLSYVGQAKHALLFEG